MRRGRPGACTDEPDLNLYEQFLWMGSGNGVHPAAGFTGRGQVEKRYAWKLSLSHSECSTLSLSLSLSLKKYSLSHARCHIVLKHSDPRKPEGKKLSESQLVPKESHYETGRLN